MTQLAPETPTTQELYGSIETALFSDTVHESRELFIGNLLVPEAKIIARGPCGLTEAHTLPEVLEDAVELATGGGDDESLIYRANIYKPRTNPNDWHGLETTSPIIAFHTILALAMSGISVTQEIAHPKYHVSRYGQLLTMAWTGSRTIDAPGGEEVIMDLASQDISLPLGIKTGLDGKIDKALMLVERVNTARSRIARVADTNSAPAFMIFRGGSELMSPELWEEEYKRAIELTEGRMMVDTAHGSSMAHDPDHKKSDGGQISAYEHVIDLASIGYIPAGVLSEASGLPTKTDPVMPNDVCLGLANKMRATVSG